MPRSIAPTRVTCSATTLRMRSNAGVRLGRRCAQDRELRERCLQMVDRPREPLLVRGERRGALLRLGGLAHHGVERRLGLSGERTEGTPEAQSPHGRERRGRDQRDHQEDERDPVCSGHAGIVTSPRFLAFASGFRGARPGLLVSRRCYNRRCVAGWSSQVARRAHNPEVAGSNPAPAIEGFLRPAVWPVVFFSGSSGASCTASSGMRAREIATDFSSWSCIHWMSNASNRVASSSSLYLTAANARPARSAGATGAHISPAHRRMEQSSLPSTATPT